MLEIVCNSVEKESGLKVFFNNFGVFIEMLVNIPLNDVDENFFVGVTVVEKCFVAGTSVRDVQKSRCKNHNHVI